MQTFTNSFNIAVNKSKTEVVLNFSQVAPIMDEDHTVKDIETFPVASLVMTGENAQRLIAVLSNLLRNEES